MGLFGRRRTAPALPADERAVVAVAPVRTSLAGGTAGLPAGPHAGTIRPPAGLPGVLLPNAYQGGVGGAPVSMRGGFAAGLQRRSGTESMSAGWYYPPTTGAAAALGNPYAASQQRSGTPGAQRIGGAPNGSYGPITARAMRANITRAQITQSGLAAVQWARSLNPTSGA